MKHDLIINKYFYPVKILISKQFVYLHAHSEKIINPSYLDLEFLEHPT